MGPSRRFWQHLDRLRPRFARGGRYARFGRLFEMVENFLYQPAKPTQVAPHVRDHINLQRVMLLLIVATLPAILFGIYNVGLQANLALNDGEGVVGWRGWLLESLAIGYSTDSLFACFIHGLLYFLPLLLVVLLVAGFWELLFATMRHKPVSEGFLVTSWLFVAVLPPTLPLWQAALGISFGIVLAKEVFGGTGKNFLNPALAGVAFLFFSYPEQITGNAVWVALDGYTAATPMTLASSGGMAAVMESGVSWQDAFYGLIPGSIGETSALACLLGALFLVYTRIASAQIMVAGVVGIVVASLLANWVGESGYSQMSWQWHLVLGGAAFGLAFMATDPVSAALTPTGKWLYGFFIGAVCVLIRVANLAYVEGMMLAILLGNIFAPLMDYLVIRLHVMRRRFRLARGG